MSELLKVYSQSKTIRVYSDASIIVEEGELIDFTDVYLSQKDKQPDRIKGYIKLTDSSFKYGLITIPSASLIRKSLVRNEIVQVKYGSMCVEGKVDANQPRINRLTSITKKLAEDGFDAQDELSVIYYPKKRVFILLDKKAELQEDIFDSLETTVEDIE